MSHFERLFRTTEDQVVPLEATVTGTIPEWLNGTLIRIGPGLFDLESGFVMNHFFDGYSVIYKFQINSQKVMFSKRFLKSEAYEKTKVYGKPAFTEFATRAYAEHGRGFLARAIANIIPDMTDNCNVNIVQISNSYFAMKGSAILREIYPEDLGTGAKLELHALLGVDMPPRLCPFALRDGKHTYFITSAHPNGHKYDVFRVTDNETSPRTSIDRHHLVEAFAKRKTICTVLSTCNSFFYSFGMTSRHIILIEQPLIYNRTELRAVVVKGASMKDCLVWNSNQMNRFYIIDKDTGLVNPIVYESEKAFFFFHHINSYEDNGEIILDLIGYDSADVINQLMLNKLRNDDCNPADKPQARRFIIPLISNLPDVKEGEQLVKKQSGCRAVKLGNRIVLSYQVICESSLELQSINMRYLGKKYRYFYATGFIFPGENKFSVIKVDCESGEVVRWFAGDGQIPSEATFIERINCKSEDDGVLLVCITSSLPHHDDRLVILDATNMQVIATASVPCHVPVSRHGIFIKS